jgi:DNA-binding CsgD family transcriptional regulator
MNHTPQEPAIERWRSSESSGMHLGLIAVENRIITLIVAGHTNNEIARRICASRRQIRRQVKTIFAKLGVANRVELVLFAVVHHLTDPVPVLLPTVPPVTEAGRGQTYPVRRVA